MIWAVGPGETAAPEADTETDAASSDIWHVVVLNDPVNLMSYVTMVFKKIFRMSHTEAERHMVEVHEIGRSIVWSGEREKAEAYVYQLQSWHLNAILENDETD